MLASTMDAYVDARFERLERALATLTDSIHKYMPQPHHSHELAAADQALHDSLQILQTHQNNHARLTALRETSDALDTQIRETLRLLWTTRRDISSTSATTSSFPAKGTGPTYDVNWEELLNYARRISKTTLPAPGILAAAAAATNGAGEEANSIPSTGDAVNTPITAAQTPALGTVPASGGANTPAPALMSNGTPAAGPAAATALPDEWARFLDPLTDMTFQPWPSEDNIRTGALAAVQNLTEQGIDPRGFDPAEEEARRAREEEERRVQEEREAKEREEQLRRARQERDAQLAKERERAREEAMRRSSVAGAAGSGGGPSPTVPSSGSRQFQFMGDLEDDDDDD